MNLPSGTVTFLFTDIEGSTRLWEDFPEAMRPALARHDDLMREAVESSGGVVFKTVGDAFCAAFAEAKAALQAAADAQRALHDADWGEVGGVLRARMAVHAGAAHERGGDYFGPPLNRVARLLSAGHGGQTLVSGAARERAQAGEPGGGDGFPEGCTLEDMGSHRLKDLQQPEHVWQLVHPALPTDFPPLRSLQAFANNLPLQATSFVGREAEMAEVRRLLAGTRLLTLAGSGGAGKTRLSLQAAADLVEGYGDGVWLVELAPLSDPALVPQALADVLGVREEPGRTLARTLADYLRPKSLLLVLDNCEHLLGACATLVDALLRSCPRVKVLASSREPLNVAGETTFRVPSLSLPDPKESGTRDAHPSALLRYEAVRLFAERAAAVATAFAVSEANAPAVARLCRRLDGIPLALELAAARVRSLSVQEIDARLGDRFRLLTGGSRTALPRQQTLRALIDWSYDLLTEAERLLLRRLSVFAGGWTLDAAEAVCSGADGFHAGEGIEDWEVLDLLTGLVDKSLVVADVSEGSGGGGGGTRYRLLETVRQYARDRLAEGGAGEAVRRRHRDFFLALAEEAKANLQGPEQAGWFDVLETEHDNLRAALEWCLEGEDRDGDEEEEGGGAQRNGVSSAEAGLRLAGALWPFWGVRGHLYEGRRRCAAALSRPGARRRTKARADALTGAGGLARRQGDYAPAQALLEEGLAIRREIGDKRDTYSSLFALGQLAFDQGDYASARSCFEETLAIRREAGDRHGVASSLDCLGSVAFEQGDYASAQALLEGSLAIYRELGDRHGVASSLNALGLVTQEQGDYASARSCFEECLAIDRELGDKQGMSGSFINLGDLARKEGDHGASRSFLAEGLRLCRELGDRRYTAPALEDFAALAGAQQQPERAARLYGASEALREGVGAPLGPAGREEVERDLAALRAALGDEAFDSAWSAGRAMTWEQAVGHALEEDSGAGGVA